MVLFKVMAEFLRPYRALLAVVVAVQAVQTFANLQVLTLNSELINKGVLRHDTARVWHVGGVMVVAALVQLAFSLLAIYCASRAATSFGRDVRSALFHRVTQFSAREVSNFGAPSLITRITNDVQQVQLLVLMTCTLVVSAPLTAVGGLVMAMRQDLGLSALLALSVPVLAAAIGQVIWRTIPKFRRMQGQIDDINRVLREQLSGLRVVRAFVREGHERARFDAANSALTGTALAAGRLMALMFPVVLLVINVSSVALIWWGGSRIAHGQTSVGSLIAFMSYFTLILTSVMMASFAAVMAPRASVSAERIREVLSTPSSVRAPLQAVTTLDPALGVELDDVTFGYEGAEEPVLSGIRAAVVPGRTLGIIGSNGSGKTSLVNLVARLFDVTEGTVRVGGVDVRDLEPELLWTRVGLVPQKAYLFSGTVRSNLLYGKGDASDEDCWDALAVAQAGDVVRALPGGLDARIEQGGTNLSGGQRQRIAIARAVIRRPAVYLFDDCFSALDVRTDARLRAALKGRTRDAAVLIVAQRVATISQADEILVLEDGRAVGLGSHAELVASCPEYREIVASQQLIQEAV